MPSCHYWNSFCHSLSAGNDYESELENHISSQVSASASVDVLSLAVAWFQCRKCRGEPFRFDEQILGGKCPEQHYLTCASCQWTGYEAIIYDQRAKGGMPYCKHYLRHWIHIYLADIKNIIQSFGQDPARITAEELYLKCGGKYKCICPVCEDSQRPAKSWREIVIYHPYAA
ncbi:hypothetical protein OBBRIDRAFT_804599 [Obba rivulosa]|uniref:Uncharacterized protein n=1 Tax=Obba rivulosa TaxID=1052685 RepID=A0A8E2AZU1_9APHY|nr:hypothetical protein OBBRIDRAFT_804599 [Obba rivulosa]